MRGLLTLGIGIGGWSTARKPGRRWPSPRGPGANGTVLAIHTSSKPLFKGGLFSNPLLVGSVLLTLVMQLAVVYVPFLQPIFETEPLTPFQFGMAILASILMYIFVRVERRINHTV